MRIIDAHMHFSNISSFRAAAAWAGVDYSAEGLRNEAQACGVTGHVCMGLTETVPDAFPDINALSPMGADLEGYEGMRVCLGINPHKLDTKSIESAINKNVAGIKIYAGYYHYDIWSEVYAPVFELARSRSLPVTIHTGDTYSDRALLTYAHPLNVDRLAVMYPDVRFVICHLGFPWVMDACEVAYKNKNVYLDLSGLVVGGQSEFERFARHTLMTDVFRQGLLFLNDYDKVLFGTDWPLAPMAEYIRFCKSIIPENAWDRVFYENASRLYFNE